jgi:fluoride exporter
MPQIQAYLAVAIGGTFGCWARYGVTVGVARLYGLGFPYATLSINVVGSFLTGLLFVIGVERLGMGHYARLGLLTGFLGGFTTFSAFALEAVLLAEQGQVGRSVVYVALSLSLGLLACLAGMTIARSL